MNPSKRPVPIPNIAEDEIADVCEHDGWFVVGGHVAGVEDVVVGEVALGGCGWFVLFGLLGGLLEVVERGEWGIPRIPSSRHRYR